MIDHFQKRGWLNCSHKSQVRLECEYEAYRRGTDKHTLRAVKLSASTL